MAQGLSLVSNVQYPKQVMIPDVIKLHPSFLRQIRIIVGFV